MVDEVNCYRCGGEGAIDVETTDGFEHTITCWCCGGSGLEPRAAAIEIGAA